MFHFSWHVLWACKTLVSSGCLKKGMCHLYLHLVTVTLKVWPLPSDFIYLHSDIWVAVVLLRACRHRWLKPTYPLSYIFSLWKPRNERTVMYIGIRRSNAKYETGMKELTAIMWLNNSHFLPRGHSLTTMGEMRSAVLMRTRALISSARDNHIPKPQAGLVYSIFKHWPQSLCKLHTCTFDCHSHSKRGWLGVVII